MGSGRALGALLAVVTTVACAHAERRGGSREACIQRVVEIEHRSARNRTNWEREMAVLVGKSTACGEPWPTEELAAQGDDGILWFFDPMRPWLLCRYLYERRGELDAAIDEVVAVARGYDLDPAMVVECVAHGLRGERLMGPIPAASPLARASLDGPYAVDAAWVLALQGDSSDLPAVRNALENDANHPSDQHPTELDAILARFGDAEAIARLQAQLEPAPVLRDDSEPGRGLFRKRLDAAAEREAQAAREVTDVLYYASLSGRIELAPSMCRHLESDLRGYPSRVFAEDRESEYYDDEHFAMIPEWAVEALQELVPVIDHPEHGHTVAGWQAWCRTHQPVD